MEFLEGMDGGHILATFLVSVAAGFAAVYIDQYLLTKVETMVGITPTVF